MNHFPKYLKLSVLVFSFFLVVTRTMVFAADDFPIRQVKVVVPFAPGGSNDVVMRLLAPALSEQIGQPVIIENRPGGGATIGMNQVAKANPDGYVLGVANTSFAANPALMSKIPFNTEKDFSSVTLIAKVPLVIVVHPSFPVRSIKELIAYAKANPKSINYGSAGNASTPHLAAELFNHISGTQMIHIPYKSGGESIAALLGGVTTLQFAAVPSAFQQIQAGRLIPLAVTTLKRDPSLPNVPTVSESGLQDFEVADWIGIVAPVGTPSATINLLKNAFVKVLGTPQAKESLLRAGAHPIGSSPEELNTFIGLELLKWQKLITAATIKID